MDKLKNFFSKKSIGFWFNIASIVAGIISLICFTCLTSVSEELDEQPAVIISLSVLAIVLFGVAAYKDWFGILTLSATTLSAFSLFNFIGGRVSYVVFYFSGDINQTGLSGWFIATFIFLVLTLVAAVCAVCFKQEKLQNKNLKSEDLL